MKFFLVIVWFMTAGCITDPLQISEIKFEAGGCYGTCPIFTMTIAADGTAHYHAEMFNKEEGEFRAVINRSRIDSLTQLIERSGFFNLKNNYSTDWTDLPAYTLTVKLKNGQTKTISDYGPSGPGKLKKIYRFIFLIKDTQHWK